MKMVAGHPPGLSNMLRTVQKRPTDLATSDYVVGQVWGACKGIATYQMMNGFAAESRKNRP